MRNWDFHDHLDGAVVAEDTCERIAIHDSIERSAARQTAA
jgi:hypothetical protein